MKIDRSFGIPFVKGFIEIELDQDQIQELMSTEVKQTTCDLLLEYLNTKFSQSSLAEGGTSIYISFNPPSSLQFTFSTYNDLVNKTIDYIINLFNETIDEYTFNYIKEHYILSYAKDINSPAVDFRNEFNETLKEKMELYSYFAADILFDYVRSQKGSGYAVKTRIENVLGKYYLFIYVLGKVYSPAEMDRLVNEGIELTFNYTGEAPIDLIRQHLKNRNSINGYAEDKFESLFEYLDPKNNFKNEKNDEENMTYKSIIEDLQEVFVTKVKRISILYHRGDLTEEEYKNQKDELDAKYYLNENIENEPTENMKYLDKFAS